MGIGRQIRLVILGVIMIYIQFLKEFSDAQFARDVWRAEWRLIAGLGLSGETVEAPLLVPGNRDAASAGQALEVDLRRLSPLEDGLDNIRSEEGKRENGAGPGARCAVAFGDLCDAQGLRVSRPMEVVVLNCWVTETKETPLASKISTILAKSERERVRRSTL